MDNMMKKLVHDTKFQAQYAADHVRNLADSKFVATQLDERDAANLQKCAIFLARINQKFDDLYDQEKAWEV